MNQKEYQYNIVKFEANHIEEVAVIHKSTFSTKHFSIYLTKNLLDRYFQNLININEFNYVIKTNGRVTGYIVAGYKTDEAIREFQKQNLLKILIILLMHPQFIYEKITELFTDKFEKTKPRIFLIGVSKEYKGLSLGSKLLDHFENELKREKVPAYGLSVRRSNQEAISFYMKKGFIKEAENNKSIFFKKPL